VKRAKKRFARSELELLVVIFFLVAYVDTLLVLLDPKIPLDAATNVLYSYKLLNVTLDGYYAEELRWRIDNSSSLSVDVVLKVGDEVLDFGNLNISFGRHKVGLWRVARVQGGEAVQFCSSILGGAGCTPVYSVPNRTVVEDYFVVYTWIANLFFTASLGYCDLTAQIDLPLPPTNFNATYITTSGSEERADIMCISNRCILSALPECVSELRFSAILGFPPLIGGRAVISINTGSRSYLSLRLSALTIYAATLLPPAVYVAMRRGGRARETLIKRRSRGLNRGGRR